MDAPAPQDTKVRVEKNGERAYPRPIAALGRLGEARHLGLVLALVILAIVGAATQPGNFFTSSNIVSILALASTIGVITVGVTFVIIGGGIDLSVGALMALASVWATTLATQSYGPVVMA